jgi:hypothetical protein
VPKSFVTVNRHDGNIVLIFCEQIRIRFDVDFFEGESLVTARGLNRVLGFVAEVAPGSRINDYMRFGQLTTPSAENIAAEIPENMLPAALHKNPNIACLEVKLQRSSQILARVGFAALGRKIVTTSTPKEFANAFSVACATRQETQGWKLKPGVAICERLSRWSFCAKPLPANRETGYKCHADHIILFFVRARRSSCLSE